MTTPVAERTLRPLRHLAWRTTAAGNVAIVLPGAAVAIGLAAQNGRPVIAGLMGLVTLGVATLVIVPALLIRTSLDADGITTFWTKRLGAVHIARAQVQHAVIRTIYNNDGVSTNRHLFLVAPDERSVHRMSDRWWTDEQLLTVAHHVGVTLESQAQPVHLSEVRRVAYSQLNWAEQHRFTAVAAADVAVFLFCLAFAALATAAL